MNIPTALASPSPLSFGCEVNLVSRTTNKQTLNERTVVYLNRQSSLLDSEKKEINKKKSAFLSQQQMKKIEEDFVSMEIRVGAPKRNELFCFVSISSLMYLNVKTCAINAPIPHNTTNEWMDAWMNEWKPTESLLSIERRKKKYRCQRRGIVELCDTGFLYIRNVFSLVLFSFVHIHHNILEEIGTIHNDVYKDYRRGTYIARCEWHEHVERQQKNEKMCCHDNNVSNLLV